MVLLSKNKKICNINKFYTYSDVFKKRDVGFLPFFPKNIVKYILSMLNIRIN